MDNKLHQTSATPTEFTFQLLDHITDHFSKERIVGRGGYGVVYKGVLDNGEEVAVKKLYQQPGLDDEQFQNEFTNLMGIQHQNIVRLVGYCYEIRHQALELNGKHVFAGTEERALCFEYLQRGSLDKHLSGIMVGKYRVTGASPALIILAIHPLQDLDHPMYCSTYFFAIL